MPRDLRMRSASRLAADKLGDQELRLPDKPEGHTPDLPHDITQLDDSDLMVLFGRFTTWLEFTGVQLAAAEVDEHDASTALERHKATAVLTHSEGAKTVTAAKAKALSSDDYLLLEHRYSTAHAYRKLLDSLYEAIERKTQFVSRELSRRIGRADVDRRQARWNP